jgi:Ca-activated chloride channel family protein
LRIADLSDRQTWSNDPYNELENAIRTTALQYQLMSDYTSFVAVDSCYRTEGGHGTTVHQALPVPDGVRYDTTVNPN